MSGKIADALQLGQTLRLANGTELSALGACPVRKLEHLMELYNKGIGYKFAYLFAKGNEDLRDSFVEILYIVCGEKYTKDELIDSLTTADEVEVYKAIHRFLGLQSANAGEPTQA